MQLDEIPRQLGRRLWVQQIGSHHSNYGRSVPNYSSPRLQTPHTIIVPREDRGANQVGGRGGNARR